MSSSLDTQQVTPSHRPCTQRNSNSCKHTPEELAALHKRKCWTVSVLATCAYHTVQYVVTSNDAGMPMHAASTCLSPLIQLNAVATEHSQACCPLELLFNHETTQACVSVLRVCACDVQKSHTVIIQMQCMSGHMHALPSQAF